LKGLPLEWREKSCVYFPLTAQNVIDVHGNYVLPGIVDRHTHFGAFLPYEDDVVSETKAAAAGGVITVFHVILEQKSVFERIPYRDY